MSQQPNESAAESIDDEFDAADPKQVSKRKQRAKQRAANDDAVLKSILATTNGRAWFWRILASCHLFGVSFDSDALRMSFREGERNVGNRLLAQLMRSYPDSFILMMRENNNA